MFHLIIFIVISCLIVGTFRSVCQYFKEASIKGRLVAAGVIPALVLIGALVSWVIPAFILFAYLLFSQE